jgi:malate dehydrogenase
MVEAIVKDKKRVLPASVYMDGEYGLNDLFFGVPVKLGANGVEEIIQLPLSDDEQAAVQKSAELVKGSIAALPEEYRNL